MKNYLKGDCLIMVRFGIIGAGTISESHAMGITGTPNAQIGAICDIIEEKAVALAEKYHVDKIYTDYHKLLKDPEIDAVSVCVPSGLHGEVVMAAARAGKHILCEKPVEITKEKIDEMIRVVESTNVKVECVFQRRIRATSMQVKAALDSGEFGKVLMASAYLKYYRTPEYYQSAGWRATWEYDGGGALMNQGVHGIDLIAWMMGGIKKVAAFTKTQIHNIPVEDAAVAAVEYENGAIGVIEGSTCTKPAQSTRFEIYCENGSIIFGDAGIIQWYLNGEEIPAESLNTEKAVAANDDPTKVLTNDHGVLVQDLVRCIEEDTMPSIALRDARKSVEAILAIYQSSREGRPIEL